MYKFKSKKKINMNKQKIKIKNLANQKRVCKSLTTTFYYCFFFNIHNDSRDISQAKYQKIFIYAFQEFRELHIFALHKTNLTLKHSSYSF